MPFYVGPQKWWLLKQSGSIVTDGLVLNLDAGNPESYSGSGTTWTDLSGNGNDGTLLNGVSYSSANEGSLVFDGTNDYVTCGNPASLQIDTAITLSSWIKVAGPGPTYRSIVSKNENYGYRSSVSYSSSPFYTSFISGINVGGSVLDSDPLIEQGIWYNITVTGDNTGLKIYINSELVIFNTTPYTYFETEGDFEIGNCSTFSEYFEGNIASILTYNRALTQQEVTQNYNALKGRYGL